MRRFFPLVLAVVLLVFGASRRASAIPMMITLDALRVSAPTIVIASFLGPVGPKGAPTGYDLLVERALQGTAPLGPMRVLRSPIGQAYVVPGTRIVAFIDKSNQLGWLGRAPKGKTLENGVLELEGLVDINTYSVSPSRVGLKQLETFLKTKSLVYDFVGPLWFPSSKGPVASKLVVKVHHDATASTSVVTGLPPMKGFPATPKVLLSNGFTADVVLTYVDTLGRPLRFAGQIDALTATGTFDTKFFAMTPGSLTEPELMTYLADPKLNHPYHELSLALADGTTWKMQLGREVGRVGELTSPAGVVTPLGAITLAPTRTIDGGALKLTLGPAAAPIALLGRPDVHDTLVQELLRGPMSCTATGKGSTKPVACTLTLAKTRFAPPFAPTP
jgi:hypothetical protein